MRLRSLLALVFFLHALLPFPVPSARGEGLPDSAQVEKGIDLYNRLEYEQAMEAFQAALADQDLDRAQCARSHTYLGVILVAMNREAEAVSSFVSLLRIDPDAQLDPSLRSPKVLEVLRSARESYIRELRASDNGAPAIQVSTREGKVPYAKRLALTFRISDQNRIVQPQIFFRKKGDIGYSFLPLDPQGGEVYLVSIPPGAVTAEALEYYVVAIDEAGNASIEGSAAIPLAIEVQPNPDIKPWYRKWWVWTLVAAAAGGATAAGVLLTSGDEGRTAAATTGSATIRFGP